MPLYNKQLFVPSSPPSDLKPHESLFYCSATKEVFRDYDAFFHRTILCNSLVWACSLTSRGSLTFEEAELSERRAKKRLQSIPISLKKALVYTVSKTKRGKLSDVLDDVYCFVCNRYFMREHVEACIESSHDGKSINEWVDCEVVKILPPTQDEIEAFKKENVGDKEKTASSKRSFEPHDMLFRYELNRIDDAEDDDEDSEEEGSKQKGDTNKRNGGITATHVVKACNIRRPKGTLTREKTSLFIKYVMEADHTVYKLRTKLYDRFNLKEMNFEDIFAGKEPVFDETRSVRVIGNKKNTKESNDSKKSATSNRQSTLDAWVNDSPSSSSTKTSSKSSNAITKTKKSASEMEQEMLRFKEEMAKRKEEAKRKRLEGIARKKEERRLLQKVISEWKTKREDLECDDLKPLPHPNPITCPIPNDLMGDFLCLLEFTSQFSDILDTSDSFPENGLDFETLQAAVISNDDKNNSSNNKIVGGAFFDVLSFLLVTIFDLQDEEQEEARLDHYTEMSPDELDKILFMYAKDSRLISVIKKATEMAKWPLKTQGVRSLRDLHMDQWTITEILRLHLLASGGFKCAGSERLCNWRYQQRGGYRVGDDPGIVFKAEEVEIMDKLNTQTIYDLSPEERLKVLTCLVHQILTFASIRDEIDDRFNNWAEAKTELRSHQISINKKLKAEKAKAKRKDEQHQQEASTAVSNSAGMAEAKDESGLTERQRLSLQSQREREDKERIKREEKAKCEAKLIEEELSEKVTVCQRKAGLFLLGRDRAYRRYWLLTSVSAVLVEHDDSYLGLCLPQPTVVNPNAGPMDTATAMLKVKKLMSENKTNQDEKGSSDKENDNNEHNPASDAHKTYSKQSSSKVLHVKETTNDESIMSGTKKLNDPSTAHISKLTNGSELQLAPQGCSGDPSSCFVHATASTGRVKWGFFCTLEEIDSLIQNLTERGFREAELKTKLQLQRSFLEQHFKRKHQPLPFKINDETIKKEETTTDSGHDKSNLKSIVDLTLRDQILELEEKIFLGSLGALKVESREKWQKAIQDGLYDPQCDQLKNCHGIVVEVDSNDRLRQLVMAVLQVAQMVEPRFIKTPLGEEEKERRKRLQEEDKKKKERKEDLSSAMSAPYIQWEQSLLQCGSYPQLFVHLTTLENSIKWSKSLLNTKCRLCRRKNDPEKMLLCDGCDRGHHLYCLKPKLKAIPEGDWFCNECRPKERIRSPKKKHRRVFSNEEEDVDEVENNGAKSDEEMESGRNSDNDEELKAYEGKGEERESESQSESDMETDNVNDEEDEENDEPMEEEEVSDEDIPLRKRTRGKVVASTTKERSSSSKTHHLSQFLTGTRRSAAAANEKIARISNGNENDKNEDSDDSRKDGNEDEEADENEKNSRSRVTRASRKRRHETATSKHRSMTVNKNEPGSKRSRASSRRNTSNEPSRDNIYSSARSIPKFSPPQLEDLLNLMMKHKDGWPFDRPITKVDAPDYSRVIAHPMDLGTIRSNLLNMKYSSNQDVLEDIELVFNNCFLYNREEAEEYQCAIRLQCYYNKMVRKMGLFVNITST